MKQTTNGQKILNEINQILVQSSTAVLALTNALTFNVKLLLLLRSLLSLNLKHEQTADYEYMWCDYTHIKSLFFTFLVRQNAFDEICGSERGWSFERVLDSKLDGFDDEKIDGVEERAECARLWWVNF